MATLLWPGKEWKVSGLEMIKGVRWGGVNNAMSYLDELVVPIIENTPDEEDLRDTMAEVREVSVDEERVLTVQSNRP